MNNTSDFCINTEKTDKIIENITEKWAGRKISEAHCQWVSTVYKHQLLIWSIVLEDKCNNQSSAKVWSHTCKLRQVLVRTWSNKCEGNSSRLQYWCVNHTLVLFDKITLPFLADYKEESAIYTWFMNHDFSHNQFSEKAY